MSSIFTSILNATKKTALMTHVVAGFPGEKESAEIIQMMDKMGAEIIEIQIPFSDPVADGPTMMACNEKAIERGMTVEKSFEMVRNLSPKITAPLLFMTYFNIVFKRGVAKFCQDAKEAGISGLIIPDMPIEEEQNEHLIEECKKNNLAWIPVVSPLTTEERIQEITPFVDGFWYVVSRTGVTGAQDEFSEETEGQIRSIKKYSDLPIAMAFGVSKSKHVKTIGQYANIAVVGSAVQNIFLQEEESFSEKIKEADLFLRGLRD